MWGIETAVGTEPLPDVNRFIATVNAHADFFDRTAPVTVAHSSTIATLRLVHPSRTNATLAPALVATTEIRLAPTATRIGRCAMIISAGTMKTPPPRPEIAPTKPAPNDNASKPARISSTIRFSFQG